MSDLNFQQLSTVQSNLQPYPLTVASAATISPQTALTRLTGTTPVTTINPPVSGFHVLFFIWSTGTSGAFATGTTTIGGVAVAKTTVTNVPVMAVFDPNTGLYYFL
jgi:hypothetical protein